MKEIGIPCVVKPNTPCQCQGILENSLPSDVRRDRRNRETVIQHAYIEEFEFH